MYPSWSSVSGRAKSRSEIIDELELDEYDIKILDNFEEYKHLIPG
jgi:hypothetical protein